MSSAASAFRHLDAEVLPDGSEKVNHRRRGGVPRLVAVLLECRARLFADRGHRFADRVVVFEDQAENGVFGEHHDFAHDRDPLQVRADHCLEYFSPRLSDVAKSHQATVLESISERVGSLLVARVDINAPVAQPHRAFVVTFTPPQFPVTCLASLPFGLGVLEHLAPSSVRLELASGQSGRGAENQQAGAREDWCEVHGDRRYVLAAA